MRLSSNDNQCESTVTVDTLCLYLCFYYQVFGDKNDFFSGTLPFLRSLILLLCFIWCVDFKLDLVFEGKHHHLQRRMRVSPSRSSTSIGMRYVIKHLSFITLTMFAKNSSWPIPVFCVNETEAYNWSYGAKRLKKAIADIQSSRYWYYGPFTSSLMYYLHKGSLVPGRNFSQHHQSSLIGNYDQLNTYVKQIILLVCPVCQFVTRTPDEASHCVTLLSHNADSTYNKISDSPSGCYSELNQHVNFPPSLWIVPALALKEIGTNTTTDH